MTIKAKFSSICPKCNRRISVGEQVSWRKGSKAEHVNCSYSAAKAPLAGTECVCGYAVLVGDTLCPTCGANLRVPGEDKPEAPASTLKPGELIAKFASRCNVCGQDINPGQTIAQPNGKGRYAHVECCGDAEAVAVQSESASHEEQHARYIDCGPNNWDDRDASEPDVPDDFDF